MKHDKISMWIEQLDAQMDANMDELRALTQTLTRGPSHESTSQGEHPWDPCSYTTRIAKVKFPKFDGKKVIGFTNAIISSYLMRHYPKLGYALLSYTWTDYPCIGT